MWVLCLRPLALTIPQISTHGFFSRVGPVTCTAHTRAVSFSSVDVAEEGVDEDGLGDVAFFTDFIGVFCEALGFMAFVGVDYTRRRLFSVRCARILSFR